MKNNFILAGVSGSTAHHFIKFIMDRSATHTVEIESLKRRGLINMWKGKIMGANAYLDKDNFGVLQSSCWLYIDQLKVAHKGLILRNLNNLYTSWYAENNGVVEYHFLKDMLQRLMKLDKYKSAGIPCYHFELLTTDAEYLNSMIRDMGIKDAVASPEDLKKKIRVHNKKNLRYNDIPKADRDLWEKVTAEYNERYFIID